MAQCDFSLTIDLTPTISRESFLAAYVDEHPWAQCKRAADTWDELHKRNLLEGEINEDPPAAGGAS